MVPDSHAALAEQLRDRAEALDGHIATYDIRQSGLAYNYAEFDLREAPLYGRLIESFGRGHKALLLFQHDGRCGGARRCAAGLQCPAVLRLRRSGGMRMSG
jgi:hypothetical protein